MGVKRGDPLRIKAKEWNEIRKRAGLTDLSVGSVSVSGSGTAQRPPVRGSGGGVGGSFTFALITSVAGTAPPYVYSAEQAEIDSGDGSWAAVSGGAVYNDLYNVEEQGAGGQWVNPLVIGDVILVLADNVFMRAHYRGTY